MTTDGPIYAKYNVHRTDNAENNPTSKHYGGCNLFVLDLDHDPYARHAAWEYAEACKATHPQLAESLRRRIISIVHPITGWQPHPTTGWQPLTNPPWRKGEYLIRETDGRYEIAEYDPTDNRWVVEVDGNMFPVPIKPTTIWHHIPEPNT